MIHKAMPGNVRAVWHVSIGFERSCRCWNYWLLWYQDRAYKRSKTKISVLNTEKLWDTFYHFIRFFVQDFSEKFGFYFIIDLFIFCFFCINQESFEKTMLQRSVLKHLQIFTWIFKTFQSSVSSFQPLKNSVYSKLFIQSCSKVKQQIFQTVMLQAPRHQARQKRKKIPQNDFFTRHTTMATISREKSEVIKEAIWGNLKRLIKTTISALKCLVDRFVISADFERRNEKKSFLVRDGNENLVDVKQTWLQVVYVCLCALLLRFLLWDVSWSVAQLWISIIGHDLSTDPSFELFLTGTCLIVTYQPNSQVEDII